MTTITTTTRTTTTNTAAENDMSKVTYKISCRNEKVQSASNFGPDFSFIDMCCFRQDQIENKCLYCMDYV